MGLGFNLELELVDVVPDTSRCGERDFVRPWVHSASSVRNLFSTNPSTTAAVFFLSSTAIGACVEVVVVVFFLSLAKSTLAWTSLNSLTLRR
jgi:hypothetical protein